MNDSKDRKRSRSRHRGDESQKALKLHHHRHSHSDRTTKVSLPFRSQHLHKHDYDVYRALFAEYLDLQKGIDVGQLDDNQVKGRWKSFLGKWNRGELAEGWYDPETKKRVDERSSNRVPLSREEHKAETRDVGDVEGDEEDYGPSLPGKEGAAKRGPTIPNLQDLQAKSEQADEDQQERLKDLRHDRKHDRNLQKQRLEELAPRAEPGTRERQLEKKREVAASNKAFADAKEAGDEDVKEGDLMGDDGIEGYKAKIKAREKLKNERELRKEEALRARAAEREERLAVHRQKEEKTMDMLKDLARQRFGGS